MKIELMDSSKRLAEQPRQQWFGDSALGLYMSLQHEQDGRSQLCYLGCAARDFASAEAAKKAAPEFARRGLVRLSDVIAD
ncbi:hypothetical protein [Paraburkholderia tropica]|uniref:hypothetical protein n=1 Tax=Paraburkholderia tropica TaxID=92647 RepID=UPI002AB69FB6|nr:hypothetical protein [Paraburkholderia tropica]